MATVGDVAEKAYKHIGIVTIEQQPSVADADPVVDEFNAIMFEYSDAFNLKDEAGVAYQHATQTPSNTFALGDRFVSGLGALVAVRAAGLLGLEGNLGPETYSASARGYGQITGAFQKSVTQDSGLLPKRNFYV